MFLKLHFHTALILRIETLEEQILRVVKTTTRQLNLRLTSNNNMRHQTINIRSLMFLNSQNKPQTCMPKIKQKRTITSRTIQIFTPNKFHR